MSWKEQLPENVREWDEVKNAETAEAFFEQMSNMRSSLGQSIRIPGEDASDETRTAFYSKLTEKVPGLVQKPLEDSEEDLLKFYRQLGAPENPEGYTYDKEDPLVGLLQNAGVEAGLTPTQFKKVADKLLSESEQARETSKAQKEQEIGDLKKEWGEAYETKRAQAELIRKQYFPFAPEGDEIGVASIKAFAKLGDQLAGEDGKIVNPGGNTVGALTPNEAKIKISEILNNKEHPYWNRRDPAHQAAREKMTRLNMAAYPN